MTSVKALKVRREAISLCLAKSMTSPKQIARQLNSLVDENKKPKFDHKIEPKQISNDLAWMKKNSMKWLAGHTLDGYVFETQNAIEQLRNMEMELQARRKPENTLDDVIKITHELKELINMRWVLMGDGPTLMHNKYVATQEK